MDVNDLILWVRKPFFVLIALILAGIPAGIAANIGRAIFGDTSFGVIVVSVSFFLVLIFLTDWIYRVYFKKYTVYTDVKKMPARQEIMGVKIVTIFAAIVTLASLPFALYDFFSSADVWSAGEIADTFLPIMLFLAIAIWGGIYWAKHNSDS